MLGNAALITFQDLGDWANSSTLVTAISWIDAKRRVLMSYRDWLRAVRSPDCSYHEPLLIDLEQRSVGLPRGRWLIQIMAILEEENQ